MKIAALLGVKDEIELIETSIRHLRAIGVDLIIAADFLSKDGTRAVLEAHRTPGELEIVDFDERAPNIDWNEFYARAVRMAADAACDWILFQDADEFWLPATGRLRDCADLASSDVMLTDRFNALIGTSGFDPPRPEPSYYDSLKLFVRKVAEFREKLAADSSAAWIAGVPLPKAMARIDKIGAVAIGGHNITSRDGAPLTVAAPSDLIIAHFPFTTRDRFARKLANIRGFPGMTDPAEAASRVGWHWRRWASLDGRDEVESEFRRNIFEEAAIRELMREGAIRSAADLMGL
jgi:hypothetical protein